MNKLNNNIDNSFREAFDKLNVPVDKLLWQTIDDSIQKKIERKSQRKKIIIAFLIGLIIPTFFYAYLNSTEKNNINSNETILTYQERDAKLKPTTDNSISKTSITKKVEDISSNQSHFSIFKPQKNQSIKKDNDLNVFISNNLKSRFTFKETINPIRLFNTKKLKLFDLLYDQINNSKDKDTLLISLKNIDSSLKTNTKPNVFIPIKQGKIFALASIGYVDGKTSINEKYLEGESHKDLPFVNNKQENIGKGVKYYLGLEYRIGNNYFFNLGFSKSTLSFQNKFQYTFNQIPIRDSATNKIITYITLSGNQVKNININERQRLKSISIPFAFGYSKNLNRNFIFELSINGALTKTTQTNITYFSIQKGNIIPIESYKEQKNWIYQANLNIGFYKKLYKNTRIGMELSKNIFNKYQSINNTSINRNGITLILKQQL